MKELIEQFGIVFPLGFLLVIIGYIWFIIVSFKANILWGLVIIFTMPLVKVGMHTGSGPPNPQDISIVNFIPLLVQLIFLFKHWDIAMKPFLMTVFGFGLMLLGFVLNMT